MKHNLFTLLLAVPLLFSCQKETVTADSHPELTPLMSSPFPVLNTESQRMNCEPFPFGILTLNAGTHSSYNLSANANIGYSRGVISTTNSNLNLNGSVYVHSLIGNFLFSTPGNAPLGIFNNNEMYDWKLDEANEHAQNLKNLYGALTPDFTFTTISTNKTIIANCSTTGMPNTIVNVGSINLNNETLTLKGDASSDDGFILNITGIGKFDDAKIKLVNIRPERVLFNFKNTTNIQVKADTEFRGTILAPNGTVLYQNPALFEGSIVAKFINVSNTGNHGCGGTPHVSFVQKTYCNGYQWE